MSISAVNNLLGVSINQHGDGSIKDTLRNIKASGEFVVNTVCEDIAMQAQTCSEVLPADVSEIDAAKLTLLPSRTIAVPRIAESPIQFECLLHSLTPFESAVLVVGRVTAMHFRTGLVSNHRIALDAYAPLGRLAGRTFCKVGDLIEA